MWFSYQSSLQTYNNEKEKLQSLKHQCSQYGKVYMKNLTTPSRLSKSILEPATPKTCFWPIQYSDFPRPGAPQQNRGEYKQLKAEDNEADAARINRKESRARGRVVKGGRRNKPSEAVGGSLYAQKRQCSGPEFSKSRFAKKKRYGCRKPPLFPLLLQKKNPRFLFGGVGFREEIRRTMTNRSRERETEPPLVRPPALADFNRLRERTRRRRRNDL